MPFMVWDDKLSVGVAVLDEDHKKLIAMINELYDAVLTNHGREVLNGILDRLVAYTSYHFAREEKLMLEAGYAGFEAHKKQHDLMSKWAVQTEFEIHKNLLPAPSLEVLNYLKDWLFDHINGSDKEYGSCLNASGIR